MRKNNVRRDAGYLRPVIVGTCIGILTAIGAAALVSVFVSCGKLGEGNMESAAAICLGLGAAVGALGTVLMCGGRIILSALSTGAAMLLILTAVGAALGAAPMRGAMPKLMLTVLLCSLAVGTMKAAKRR